MGSRLRYRSEALAAIGGDLPGLVRLLPIQSVTRTAFFVPAMPVLSVALFCSIPRAIWLPVRHGDPVLHVLPKAERIIPSMPGGVVPVSLTGALLRTLAVAGLGWAIANLVSRRSLRAFLYAVIVLCGIVLGAAVFWVTGMKILASRSWGHDGIQGFALLAFLFGFVGMLYLALWQWWIDVENRCPYCLRLPGMSETRGNAHVVLVDHWRSSRSVFPGMTEYSRADGGGAFRLRHLERTVGRYYVIDIRCNCVTQQYVDVEDLARELKLLRSWEEMRAESGVVGAGKRQGGQR
jgi:hypothetical protein